MPLNHIMHEKMQNIKINKVRCQVGLIKINLLDKRKMRRVLIPYAFFIYSQTDYLI